MDNIKQFINSIDRLIGSRLRQKRLSNKWSEQQLADLLGLKTEDIVLFEQGRKRVSAEQLLRLAIVFEVHPAYFFGVTRQSRATSDDNAAEGAYLSLPEQGLRLHRAFASIRNPKIREAVVAFVAAIASAEEKPGPKG